MKPWGSWEHGCGTAWYSIDPEGRQPKKMNPLLLGHIEMDQRWDPFGDYYKMTFAFLEIEASMKENWFLK